MNTPTLDALRRVLETRRRIDAIVWKARAVVIARQLREMREQS